MAALGKSFITCELQLAGPEYDRLQGFSSLPPAVAEQLFNCEPTDKDIRVLQALSPDMSAGKKASVTVDNSLSPTHTLLQVQCFDQKGLVYDIMRTSKDCDIQVLSHEFLSYCSTLAGYDCFIEHAEA